MAMPFMRVLIAAASLSMAYSVFATTASARADDISLGARVPVELLQWHSGLSMTGDAYGKPEGQGTPGSFDPEEALTLLRMHGAAGIRDVPKVARKSARNPPFVAEGSAQRGL